MQELCRHRVNCSSWQDWRRGDKSIAKKLHFCFLAVLASVMSLGERWTVTVAVTSLELHQGFLALEL